MAYRRKPWVAKVVLHGKQVQIGTYETREEAEEAEETFRIRHGVARTTEERAAKAHATLRSRGTYRNQHTKGRS